MKRLLRASGTHLTVLFLAASCFAAMAVLSLADSPVNAAQSAPNLAPAPALRMALPGSNAIPLLGSPGVITCTNTYTTTWDTVGGETGNDFDTYASLAPYEDLSLVGTAGAGTFPEKRVFTETFRLDNPKAGTKYKVEAIPYQTNNYNLGITVYNNNRQILNVTGNPNENPTDYRASVEFVADGTVLYYYIKIYQITQQCRGGTYDLTYSYTDATATPTPTATPTGDPWAQQDSNEPNENINSANVLATPTGRSLFNNTSGYADPRDDNDWYTLYGAAGYQYAVSAARDNGTTDLYFFMEIYAPDKTTRLGIVESSTNPSINWTAGSSGNHYIHIKRATGSPTNGTYKITVTTNAPPTPTFTATPGGGDPTETPIPGADIFEPNYDFEHAGGIGLNVKYTNLNFVPTLGGTVDNDFYKLRVKRGMLVTCETLDLSAGTDTNMILYRDDQAGSCKNRPVLTCEGLAGNDDVDTARGELRSRLTVSIDFDGFLYALVGQGYNIPPGQASQYTYALQCTSGQTNVTSTPAPPTWTPRPPPVVGPTVPPPPPTVPSSATPLPSPVPVISVRPLATSTPSGPPQQIVTADLRVSYDANGNGSADPGEGVVGLPVRVYDDTSGALLAQGFTDDTGHAVFSVPSAGPIRVVVPYLSFETVVPPVGAAIPVLISPRELPEQIP